MASGGCRIGIDGPYRGTRGILAPGVDEEGTRKRARRHESGGRRTAEERPGHGPGIPRQGEAGRSGRRQASRSEACRCGSEACTADSARFISRNSGEPCEAQRGRGDDTTGDAASDASSDASLTNASRCCGSAACCHAARRAERARSHGCTAGGRARRDARFTAACRRRSGDATRSDRRRDPPAVAGCGQGRQRR